MEMELFTSANSIDTQNRARTRAVLEGLREKPILRFSLQRQRLTRQTQGATTTNLLDFKDGLQLRDRSSRISEVLTAQPQPQPHQIRNEVMMLLLKIKWITYLLSRASMVAK